MNRALGFRLGSLLMGIVGVVLLLSGALPQASVLRARTRTMLTPSGEIVRISIPTIGVNSRVIEVGQSQHYKRREWQVADYAVGHHADSGAPGDHTNIVLSGHNNINGSVFRRLDGVRPGDVITLETDSGEKSYAYKVTRTHILLQDGASEEQQRRNARHMRPTPSEQLILISCWPYSRWPNYRIIIVADPV